MPKKISLKIKKSKKNDVTEKFVDAFHTAADELSSVVSKAKKQYAKMDKKTSKKLLAGILGATVVLAGTIGMRKLQKKKNGL